MSILITALLVIWMIVALLMILVILMQRPKSEGLGAAFGGGVTENIFGAQTTNVLVKFTGYLAAIFFLITFTLSILYAKQGSSSDSAFRKELLKTAPAPQASAAPITAQPSPAAAAPLTSPAAVAPIPLAAPTAAAAASVAPADSPLPSPAAADSATPSASASVAPSVEPEASASPQKAPTRRKKR
ncbi:MAG TPA: preprotein translocase subunit SecG [Chthoniobacterales bacterium]